MIALKKFTRVQLLTIIVSTFFVSCLKDDTEKYQDEHDQKMEDLKIQYGIDESHLLVDNIYLKFLEVDTLPGAESPGINDLVIVDYFGTIHDGRVVEVSVEEIAKEKGIYADDFIYGPARLWVGYRFLGFQKAIQYMKPKSTAIMLIPNDQWNTYFYEPLVYEVTLYRVIKDLEEYNNQQVSSYLDSLGMIAADDTIPGYGTGGIWVKDFTERENNGLVFGDTVLISIHGYYVEADTSYMDDFPGRQFFPISNSGDSVIFTYGEEFFPITLAVNEVIKFMDIGETIDMVTVEDYAFDDAGFLHPYTGDLIIPPVMPLHYTIELVDTMKVGD